MVTKPAEENTSQLKISKNKNPIGDVRKPNPLNQQTAAAQTTASKVLVSVMADAPKPKINPEKSGYHRNPINPLRNLAGRSEVRRQGTHPSRKANNLIRVNSAIQAQRPHTENRDSYLPTEIMEESTGPLQKPISGFQVAPVSEEKMASPEIGNTASKKILPDPIGNNQQKAPQKINQQKQKTRPPIYAGLVIAPDLSLVRFQPVTSIGYTLGAFFGYPISSRFALESGLYFDEKKYYTNGEYFSKKNVDFLNYVNLLNVNGSCNMLEVPINLRYNITNSRKNKWFVTGGLSTYFMFKEAYSYKYIYNGNEEEKYKAYNNPSQNWFSIMDFSAGYEHYLGKLGSLRIEPYLRVPLAGMGTGSLPIMSAGLNVGINHPFK
jgi:hypothetical protein